MFGGDAVSKGRAKGKKGDDPSKQIEAALLADDPVKLAKMIRDMEREMRKAAENLDFEKAAQTRDKLLMLKDLALKNPM